MSLAAKALFEGLARGPLPDWDGFAASVTERRIDAGGTVFLQEVEHPHVHVVRAGLVKLVYLRDSGDEWIKSFVPEGLFFASMSALASGGRTSFGASALEDTVLERFDYRALEARAETHLAWSTALRRALTLFAERKEARERELLTLSAEERYRRFSSQHPELLERIPQKELALYLGVTPVGLNRIARRIRLAAE